MAFLDLTHVSKLYAGAVHPAVVDFNLKVDKGEFVSFLGPSGCGKTTTLRMIAGFEEPSAGSILMQGKELTNLRPNQRGIGMVFQSYALFPNLTVADNIGFGLKVSGTERGEIDTRAKEMLALIRLEHLGARYPYQLSGGQQQRVALARALAIRPTLLLLDEPLSALDAKIRVSLRNEIRAIQQQLHITTIYVTHDQEEALSLSDRIVVMSEGRIEQVGTPFEIYNYPRTQFVATFVGTLNSIKAEVVDAQKGVLRVQGQEIHAATSIDIAKAGDTIPLALRPELLALEPGKVTNPANPTENRLSGTLENVTFLGSIVRMRVQVGQESIVLDTFNNPSLQLPAMGSNVTVYFGREACLVLQTSAATA
jgi:putative spermidine/putrescine transport system ATP-binding protein